MARSACASLARKTPDWASSWSTSVVLPWSTWAMMAMLRSDMGFLKACLGSEEGALVGERSHNRQLRVGACDPAAGPARPSCCAVQPKWGARGCAQDPEKPRLSHVTVMKLQVFCRRRLRRCALHHTLDL